jgi:spoIIIJ-associated protein
MNDLKQRYFFGDTLEQAVMRAASHFQLHPDEVAYQRVEKRHGFLRVRRRVVIEVDPDRPKRAEIGEPDPLKSSVVAATQQRRKSRGRGGRKKGRGGGNKGERKRQPQKRESRSGQGKEGRGRGGDRRASSRQRKESREGGNRAAQRKEDGKPAEDRGAKKVRASKTKGELVELPDAPKRAIERYPAAEGPEAEAAEKALDDLLQFAALRLEHAVLQGEDRLEVELWGPDQKRLLAHHGKLLMAIQRMLPRLIRGAVGEGVPCRVDCDNYHEIRQEQLRDLAQRTAGEVIRKGRPKTLAPMRPDERRIIHLALSDDPAVTTESQGNGLLKRVMVKPTGQSRS